MRKHCILGLLLIVFGCNKFENETKQLNAILSKYNTLLAPNHHLYVLRSKFVCEGCVQSVFIQLNHKLVGVKNIPITILSPNDKFVPKPLLAKTAFILDSLGVSTEKFPDFFNLTFFETQNGKVVAFKNMSDTKKLDLPHFVNAFIKEEKN